MRYATLLAAGFAAVFNLNVQAAPAECEQLPPLYDSGHYFDHNDSQPITAINIRKIEHFAKALEGKWRGTGTVVDCIDRQRQVVSNHREFDFVGETIEFNNGALELKGEQTIVALKTVQLEQIPLTPAIYNKPGLQRWHTLEFEDDNTMIFSQKYRRGTARGLNQFVHEIKKVTLRDGVLKIDRKKFINGLFAYQSGTTLVRLPG